MKKTIIISVAVLALVFSVWGFFKMRSTTVSKNNDVLVSVPAKPYAILRINQLSALSEDLLYNNNYWRSLAQMEQLGGVHKLMCELDSLKDVSPQIKQVFDNRSLMLSAYHDSTGTSILASSQMSASDYSVISGHLAQKGYSKNCRHVRDIFLFSADSLLLQKAVTQTESGRNTMQNDSIFSKVYSTAGGNVAANLFVDMSVAGKLLAPWGIDSGRIRRVALSTNSWCGFDMEIGEDKITISGFGDNSSKDDLGHLFDGQSAGENSLVKALPYNTYFFNHYSISNLELFRERLSELRAAEGRDSLFYSIQSAFESPSGETPLLFFQEHFGGEIALGMNYMGQYVIVKLNNARAATERLKRYRDEMPQSVSVTQIDGMDIYKFPQNGFAGGIFGETFTLPQEYIGIYDNYLVIAENQRVAAYVANRNPNTQTLQCSPVYKQANLTLLSSSNMSIYADIPYIVRNAKDFIAADKLSAINDNKSILANFESFGMQEEASGDGLNYRQMFLQYNPQIQVKTERPVRGETAQQLAENQETKEETNVEATQEAAQNASETANAADANAAAADLLFSVELDAPARTRAFPVTNHYTGATEFAIQDSDNKLYLINHEGKILWKAQLTGAIQGEIHQVDMLKNKKLQMAFVTKDKFFIVDRNGNNLKGFPKTLDKQAVAGLSVFDYENNLNYRFFYPAADGTIVLLRADGTTPPDWKRPKLSSTPQGELQYFRLNNKDYLLAADEHKCYYFDRKGKDRILPEKNMPKSANNPFYVDGSYDNKRFVYSTSDGQICFVEQTGKVGSVRIDGREEGHCFASFCEDKDMRYVFYDKSGLYIYDKDFNLLSGESQLKTDGVAIYSAIDKQIAVYDAASGCCMVYDVFNAAQVCKIEQAANFITLCKIKPYRKTAIATCNGKSLIVYGF